VEIETFANQFTTFLPIYVEVVPFSSPDVPACTNIPGYVILVAFGDQYGPCGTWTKTIGPVDITSHVPLGSLYGIRIHSLRSEFGHWESPALDCIRVTAHANTSSIAANSWGRVKQLYK
jgi:hypothetical protein